MKSDSIVSLQSSLLNIEHVISAAPSAFSEDEILAINELLLSRGLHIIKVSSVLVGRNIICMFLKLLNYYHTVYWLTEDGLPIELNAFDMKGLLQKDDYMFSDMLYHIDCLIIECDIEQLQQFWYAHFQYDLSSSSILTNIPIIQITC